MNWKTATKAPAKLLLGKNRSPIKEKEL